jgi:membrane protein
MANSEQSKVVQPIREQRHGRVNKVEPSAWQLGGLSVAQLGKRLWTDMDADHDDTFGRAAELSYYFLLAIFPGLLFLLTIMGLVAGNNPNMQSSLFSYAGQVLPGSALEIVQKTVQETVKASGGWKLIIGLLGALWSASSGMASLMTVLNQVHHVKDQRPFWKSRLLMAPGLTIALSLLMLAALGIVLFGGTAATWAGQHGLGEAAVLAWRIVQWPLALAFVVFAFAVLYYFAPDLHKRKWYWITPGSLGGVVLWVVASIAFRVYLHFFNSYSATYGSLGAVIILMLWFYITSLSLLIGSEINAEIENAAAEHGRADAKFKGEKKAPAA